MLTQVSLQIELTGAVVVEVRVDVYACLEPIAKTAGLGGQELGTVAAAVAFAMEPHDPPTADGFARDARGYAVASREWALRAVDASIVYGPGAIVRSRYDMLPDGDEAEIEVTVVAVTEPPGDPPMLLVKFDDDNQLELWSATPGACCAARSLARGEHITARIAKCQHVISDRNYGGVRKLPIARVRFARLLECRSATA